MPLHSPSYPLSLKGEGQGEACCSDRSEESSSLAYVIVMPLNSFGGNGPDPALSEAEWESLVNHTFFPRRGGSRPALSQILPSPHLVERARERRVVPSNPFGGNGQPRSPDSALSQPTPIKARDDQKD